MDDIGGGLSFMAILGFVAFLIWNRDRSKQEQQRQKLAEREKLLDRIGTGEALTSFLRTDEGKRLFARIGEPEMPENRGGMRASFLRLLTAGVIATLTGVGFWYVAPLVEPELLIPGAVIGAIGLGCIAAAVLHYVFGKIWGTYDPEEENGHSARRLE